MTPLNKILGATTILATTKGLFPIACLHAIRVGKNQRLREMRCKRRRVEICSHEAK